MSLDRITPRRIGLLLFIVLLSCGMLRMGQAQSSPPAGNKAAAATSDEPSSPGLQKKGGDFELSILGHKIHITVAALRGKKARFNLGLSEDGNISYLTMTGLVRIDSDIFKLECENLNYDAPEKKLVARYNVAVRQEGITATCGQMVYDLEKDTITLTVTPDVFRESEQGTLHIWDMEEFVIVRNPNGKVDVSTTGENTQIEILSSTPAKTTRSADTPTTTAAREISPEAPQLPATPTATPKSANNR
jgi:hypothetical protein